MTTQTATILAGGLVGSTAPRIDLGEESGSFVATS